MSLQARLRVHARSGDWGLNQPELGRRRDLPRTNSGSLPVPAIRSGRELFTPEPPRGSALELGRRVAVARGPRDLPRPLQAAVPSLTPRNDLIEWRSRLEGPDGLLLLLVLMFLCSYEYNPNRLSLSSYDRPAIPGISLVNLRCTSSIARTSFLRYRHQNCAQYSRCLTNTLYNCSKTSLSLYSNPLTMNMVPGRVKGFNSEGAAWSVQAWRAEGPVPVL